MTPTPDTGDLLAALEVTLTNLREFTERLRAATAEPAERRPDKREDGIYDQR